MSTAIVQTQPAPLATPTFFTAEQEQMILRTFLGGATKDEAAVLLEVVKRRRLDPFARQVYFVKRWDSQKREEVWAIQTSIDGLRSIAERTGKYDGQDDPVYGKDDFGEFCKVRVYRKDWSAGRAAVGTAYMAEFIQKKKDGTTTAFWARMPRLMLAKCAEALAIRKAFPEDTGGLYIAEEMGQEPHAEKPAQATVTVLPAPAPVEAPPPAPAPAKMLNPRAAAIWKRAQSQGLSKETFPGFVSKVLGTAKPSNEWTDEDMGALEEDLAATEDIKF